MYPEKLKIAKTSFYSEQHCFRNGETHYVEFAAHTAYDAGMYSHEFFEIDIIFGGSGCHYVDETSVPANVGDVFVIPPYVMHGYYGDGCLDICHIKLKSNFMNKYQQELSQLEGFSKMFTIEPYLRKVYDKNLFLHLGYPQMLDIKSKLNKMITTTAEGHHIYTAVAMLSLIGDLCYCMHQQPYQSKDVTPTEADILNVLEYIQNNFKEKITVEDMLNVSKMSRATFNRQFKKIVGMTPMNYIISCRVNAARNMMSKGKYSKTEIAQSCGFYDVSHMDKYLVK